MATRANRPLRNLRADGYQPSRRLKTSNRQYHAKSDADRSFQSPYTMLQASAYEDVSYPLVLVDMARSQAKSKSRRIGGILEY